MQRAIITQASPGWRDKAKDLHSGGHLVLLSNAAEAGVQGRLVGLELRDAITVFWPGPVSSFVFLFRVPVERTIVAQVLATGTGAINVDGCRVGSANTRRVNTAEIGYNGNRRTLETYTTGSDGGRWPPNVLFVHGPNCRNVGTKRVRSPGGMANYTPTGQQGPVSVTRNVKTGAHFGDADGMEDVPDWECEPSCPVGILDAQSEDMGMHSAGSFRPPGRGIVQDSYNASSYEMPPSRNLARFGDTGGASRFFPQFRDRDELLAWLVRLVHRTREVAQT
jgi:hypothetical protein